MGAYRSANEFRLLGPVEAVVEGRPLSLGGRRQRALLALLLLEPGRAVSADRLAEELWQGEPPAGAEKTLRSYVSRLRATIGREAVVTEAGGYALTVEPESVDAHRFARLLGEGREALARGAAGRGSECLSAALGLWRGHALMELADQGGVLANEARRLEELRLLCLEERIEADLVLGRHEAVVSELQALVREEPLRERFWGQLVLALYRSDRQAEALAAYQEARGLLDRELGLEPGEELRALQRAILRQEVVLVVPVEARHNLPAPTTSFVGRDGELAELERLLGEHRLLTVTGLGGCGKTRLALETARRQAEAWAGGVWFVDLTALADPELVVGAVAASLGLAERSLAVLLAHAARRELLLVLDNCEHLVSACAELAETLLGACPHVRILATSRVPLAVRGEFGFALDPLAVPGEGVSVERLGRSPAVRLFVERAAAVRRDVASGDEQMLATAGAICRALDGLPLAIELAAARARALSLEEIAARVDDRYRFLRAWQRVADPRHGTLEATMDWSYELLAAAAQELLRRLTVFAGGTELEAIAEVCLDGDEERALEVIARLVDASLVQAEAAGERTRYRLLETVREYAAAKLDDDPGGEAVRRRHAQYYRELAERLLPQIEGTDVEPALAELDRERDNLLAAVHWASAARETDIELRIAVALRRYWHLRGDFGEGRRLFERVIAGATGGDPVLRATALFHGAYFAYRCGDTDTARREWQEARELFRARGLAEKAARCTGELGNLAKAAGDAEAAERFYREATEVFAAHGDRMAEALGLGNLATLAAERGDYEAAEAENERVVAIERALGKDDAIAVSLHNLARVKIERGRLDEAHVLVAECLEIAVRLGYRELIAYCLGTTGELLAYGGESERAARLLGRSRALFAEIGIEPSAEDGRGYGRALALLADALGPVRLQELSEVGVRLPLDDTIAEAVKRIATRS